MKFSQYLFQKIMMKTFGNNFYKENIQKQFSTILIKKNWDIGKQILHKL